MVVSGMANSRMNDYYDVWMLTSALAPDRERLRRVIVATFARGTANLSPIPDGLSDEFAEDPSRLRQWTAFARNLSGSVPEFSTMVAQLRDRLAPHLTPT